MRYFEEIMSEGKRNVKVVVNLLLNDLLRVLNKDDVNVDNRCVTRIVFTNKNVRLFHSFH